MVTRYDLTEDCESGEIDITPVPEHLEGRYVTYEDYQKLEAELEQLRQQVAAPADDGWIEWAGGACPCDYLSIVEVRLRSGNEREARGALSWEWKHYNSICDIIAYRVVKP